MKFLLMGQEATTLPYAVIINADSLEAATSVAAEMKESPDRVLFQPHLMADLETGDVVRIVWDSETQGYISIDCAFDQFGIETPNEYFTTPQTAEMQVNDC